jgi:hypothetical protein
MGVCTGLVQLKPQAAYQHASRLQRSWYSHGQGDGAEVPMMLSNAKKTNKHEYRPTSSSQMGYSAGEALQAGVLGVMKDDVKGMSLDGKNPVRTHSGPGRRWGLTASVVRHRDHKPPDPQLLQTLTFSSFALRSCL